MLLADDVVRMVTTVLSKFSQSNNNNELHKVVKSVPPIITGVTENSRGSFPLGFGHACQYVGQRVALVG
jgi:hypothetical protein